MECASFSCHVYLASFSGGRQSGGGENLACGREWPRCVGPIGLYKNDSHYSCTAPQQPVRAGYARFTFLEMTGAGAALHTCNVELLYFWQILPGTTPKGVVLLFQLKNKTRDFKLKIIL